MNTWIISYKDDAALEEILKIGEVVFQPSIPKLKFIAMDTYLSEATILLIEGVTACEPDSIGYLPAENLKPLTN